MHGSRKQTNYTHQEKNGGAGGGEGEGGGKKKKKFPVLWIKNGLCKSLKEKKKKAIK